MRAEALRFPRFAVLVRESGYGGASHGAGGRSVGWGHGIAGRRDGSAAAKP